MLNTLFCSANHFYPPTINFTWTKNEVEVTDGVINLRYSHNSDGTFHRISTLSFSPKEGDIYSCTVQHQASRQAVTRSWGKFSEKSVSFIRKVNKLLNSTLFKLRLQTRPTNQNTQKNMHHKTNRHQTNQRSCPQI